MSFVAGHLPNLWILCPWYGWYPDEQPTFELWEAPNWDFFILCVNGSLNTSSTNHSGGSPWQICSALMLCTNTASHRISNYIMDVIMVLVLHGHGFSSLPFSWYLLLWDPAWLGHLGNGRLHKSMQNSCVGNVKPSNVACTCFLTATA